MDKTSPVAPPTFSSNWGRYYVMAPIILLEALGITIFVSPVTGLFCTIAMVCLEYTIFRIHVTWRHPNHPLSIKILNIDFFEDRIDELVWITYPDWAWKIATVLIAAFHMIDGSHITAVAIVGCLLMQGLISRGIDRIQHRSAKR